MRLNKLIRDSIVKNALIKANVVAREEAIMDSAAELAEAVRVFYYGGKKKLAESMVIFEQIRALEEKAGKVISSRSAMRNHYEIEANFAGMRIDLQFNGEESRSTGSRQTVRKTPCTYNRVDIPQGNKLVDKFLALETEKKAVKELRESITLQVSATVKSVGTIEKLLKQWPEAKELLPTEEAKKASMPVVQAKELNALIGLPS